MSESLDRVSSILAATPRRWLDLAATVPEDMLGRPAIAGEWSAIECLRHLLQAERHVLPKRVEEILAGAEELSPVDPAAIPPLLEHTAGELAEAFARAREESIGRVAALKPEDLERGSRSRRLGPVTLRNVLHQWALHDLEHTLQAERALFQALLVDSGPARGVYPALDLEAERVEA